ncbi:TPA: hypothetical protein KD883_002165 [Vibrio parahaemolyticus]|nr:hypothetical protein [Vibrio parahaemolyticus]
MAMEISLNEDELKALQEKLQNQKATLPENEVNLIEAILKKADEAKKSENIRDAGWYFSWTYRF